MQPIKIINFTNLKIYSDIANFIFKKKKLEENIEKLKNAFKSNGINFEIFYSVKTNFANEVLDIIHNNCEFEIVSL